MAICLLGYAGFPRFNKMASMGECDAKFYNKHLEKFLLNQARLINSGMEHGSAHCSNSYICPVAMLEQYMKLDEIKGDLDKLVFRGPVLDQARISAQGLWWNQLH